MRLPPPLAACCWIGFAITLFVSSDVRGAHPKSLHTAQSDQDHWQRAAAMVEEALAGEAAGNGQSRDELINQAIQLAPDFDRAHWAAGQVRAGDRWVSLAEAERTARNDPAWAQYGRLREEKETTPNGQEALAIWCRKHKLNAQSHVHLRNVLKNDPQNAQALKELNLHWHQDRLLTNAEFAELKHQEAQVAKATKHWQPKLVAWRKDIASSHSATAEKARDGIQSIDDPAVIPVFETLLTHDSPDNNNPEFSRTMVRSLGKLHGTEVTCALARQALRARWPDVRGEAITQLSTRELTDYVPYVLGLLQSPIRRTSNVYLAPDGNVYHYWRNCQTNVDAEDIRENLDKLIPVAGGKRGTGENAQQTALAQAQRDEFWSSKAITDQNALWDGEVQNARNLFRANAQTDQGNDPQDWWNWWADYNELQYSGDKSLRAFWHANATVCFVPVSCFVAGTKVSTQTGLRPIEEIKPGDAVLAQDPQTGELAYQCVLATTIRPPSPLRKLTVAGEKIITTRGHRFWREGRGWQMAKHLSEDSSLHSVSGPVPIAAIEDAGEDQAYNLVVEKFHTYFVGEHRLLVHDNSVPKPVVGPVPGMSIAEH